MQEHVGDSFNGIISGVTGFGLFVELADIYVEGLIHITALTSDYYRFDAVRQQLTGENSGRIYRLGDSIRVTVARVDLDERKIDFVLAKDETSPPTKSKAKSTGKEKAKVNPNKAANTSRQPAKTNAKTSAKGKTKRGANAAPVRSRKSNNSKTAPAAKKPTSRKAKKR